MRNVSESKWRGANRSQDEWTARMVATGVPSGARERAWARNMKNIHLQIAYARDTPNAKEASEAHTSTNITIVRGPLSLRVQGVTPPGAPYCP